MRWLRRRPQRGTYCFPEVGLPDGFVPPSAALAPPPPEVIHEAITYIEGESKRHRRRRLERAGIIK